MSQNSAETFFEGQALELGRAIEQVRLDRVETLAKDVPLNSYHRQGMTFLHFALLKQLPQVVGLLVRSGADPHLEVQGLGSTIGCAVMAEDTAYLRAMLDHGVSANATDAHGMPLFFFAAAKDSPDALRLMIERGAKLNTPSPSGRTAILHVFLRLKYDQVEFLIAQGVTLDIPTSQGVTLPNALERELFKQQVNPETRAYQKLLSLKAQLEARGIRFPSESPEQIRHRLGLHGHP